MKKVFLILLAALAVAIAGYVLIGSPPSSGISAEITNLQTNASRDGYARADRIRDFKFPDDHGPHPEFQTEWWYYTGNVDTADGRHLGYQFTIFRQAVTPTRAPRESDWATNQIYFAHFAISDVKNNSHTAAERFSRGALELAGATGNPFRVWLENWEIRAIDLEGNRVRLLADDSGNAIDLTLTTEKPPVLHGERGLSQKSAGVGNASYYVSFTRLETSGRITVNGETVQVKGLSWMDHEFSTTPLPPGAVGWDWFSIQLSDRRELMLFQIRQKDGGIEPLSSGTLVEPDGSTRHLTRDQFDIKVLATWKSSQTKASYPSRWNIAVPSADIRLDLVPYIADQEMRVSIIYWEGTVNIRGASRSAPVTGNGYVEMTGYARADNR